MLNEVGLYFNNSSPMNGPGKVCRNLLLGLKRLGVSVRQNVSLEYTGFLQPVRELEDFFESNFLLGPNLFVLPSDVASSFWESPRKLVVPCQWVKNLYREYLDSKHDIYTWPTGIDTDKFYKKYNKEIKYDCLIYFKNGSAKTLQELISILEEKSLTYRQITYGSYNEDEFIQLAQSSRFGVTVTRTESQGIAYQEMLSMNLPLYVLDKLVWDDMPHVSFPATSAPYFDDRCGIKHPDLSGLEEFIEKQDEFEPREYILENLTLEKCARKYVSLLEFCNDHKT